MNWWLILLWGTLPIHTLFVHLLRAACLKAHFKCMLMRYNVKTCQVDNLCIRNESPNCVLDDMLPIVTSNCVDTIESLDTLNIIMVYLIPLFQVGLVKNQHLRLPAALIMMINKIPCVKGFVK